MILNLIKHEENKSNYQDCYDYWASANILSILGYILFLLIWADYAPNSYNTNFVALLGTILFLFLIATMIYFVIHIFVATSFPAFEIFSQNRELTKKSFIILYIISFVCVLVYGVYGNYTIKSNLYYYTTNHETYHLYDNCITIHDTLNLRRLNYEDIDEDKICAVCKWHYESPQSLNKKERRPND